MADTHPLLKPWQPSKTEPWNLQRVWHVHRRAGFGATWSELQRDLNDGPDQTIDRFLNGQANSAAPDDFADMSTIIGDSAQSSLSRIKAWWVYCLLYSPDPLGEKLTLMWHNHFATSNVKVQNPSFMYHQNRAQRKFCRDHFSKLLHRVIKDPAMLIWLDAAANRKTHPNEYLARELLELFTLGEGHYSEHDVQETARCLTGLRVKNGAAEFVDVHFDATDKTVLGQTGRFHCDELLSLLVRHPETARRIAWRLCDTFFAESVATKDLTSAVTQLLIENDLHIGRTVAVLLRSATFFSGPNLRTRISSPVEFAISTLRALELTASPPSTVIVGQEIAALGQSLFEPPNVFGWPGGRAWITTRSLAARNKFIARVLAGQFHRDNTPFDGLALLERHQIKPSDAGSFFARLLTGMEPKKVSQQTVREVLSAPSTNLQ